MEACESCRRRSWLLERLSGHIENLRARLDELLELPDPELIAAVGGGARAELEAEYSGVEIAGLTGPAICRCDPAYPANLEHLGAPPPVLYLAGRAGELAALPPAVAIVGTRRPSTYGLEVARSLARGLRSAGVPVISGMAAGIDLAAHLGALEAAAGAGVATVAVMPGPVERPYPPSHANLHAKVAREGLLVSEVPPGGRVRRWRFLARNRTIAGLAAVSVVVEAGARSGALVTARHARSLGRELAAVPGRITEPQAAGSNGLLVEGARTVRGPQDVLDLAFGAGMRQATLELRAAPGERAQAVLQAVAGGAHSADALLRLGLDLGAIAELELEGWIRRGPGGRLTLIP